MLKTLDALIPPWQVLREIFPLDCVSVFLFLAYFHRIMYWTDWGFNPKIEKANMAGKERSVLIDSVLHWPNGLTLDKDTNRLYWVDGSYHKLEYLDLDNNNRVTLLISSSVLPHPFGLTLLGDHVYWTDWSTNAVYRANKRSLDHITPFITGIGEPMDIHGYNASAHIAPGNHWQLCYEKASQ